MLAGCGFHGVYNVPLPGGADLGSHPYRVTAQFTDALDLVPQSGVRVNNVAVGRVSKITLEPNGKLADVTLEINDSVHLPANAVASIQQTSLLGEKFVDLAPPTTGAPTGTLTNGATITVQSTSQGVQLEQVFGALSLLLNGGGVGQLQQISTELNKAADGKEADIRSFLTSADKVIGQLNKRRDSITEALDGLNGLSKTLAQNNGKIDNILANFSPGLQVLADQRTQLVSMLHSLDQLSQVTVSTLNASQRDIVHDLQTLQPILQNLANAGAALPQSLQVLFTYPFGDGALGAIRGDYLNTFVTENLRTPGGNVVTSNAWPAVSSSGTGSTASTSAASSIPPTIAPPPGLLPPTSSALPGMPSSTIVTSPSGSASTSPTGSASGSSSAPGSASGSNSPSGSNTPSGSGSASSSGSGSATGSSSATTGSSAPGGGS